MSGATIGKLLVVLNEAEPGSHTDWHAALEAAHADGVLGEWTVYPYVARQAAGLTDEAVGDEIAEAAQGAGAVLWCHPFRLRPGAACLDRIRSDGDAVWAYWDGDWYHWLRRPFPSGAREIAGRCDVAFMPGDGDAVRTIRRCGCPDVRYAPESTDARFLLPLDQTVPDADVVMIANAGRSRNPARRLPGAAERRDVARLLQERFGERFAVYGAGWAGASARGCVAFAGQTKAYRRARVVVGANNWDARYYFSNRLPIAMSSGRPVVYRWSAGYDEVFGEASGVHWYRTAEEAVELVDRLLQDPDERLRSAEASVRFVRERLTHDQTVRYMLECIAGKREGSTPANPWIARAVL